MLSPPDDPEGDGDEASDGQKPEARQAGASNRNNTKEGGGREIKRKKCAEQHDMSDHGEVASEVTSKVPTAQTPGPTAR